MNNRTRKVIALASLPFLLAACHLFQQPAPSSSVQSSDSPYPAHWWTPVPKDGAQAWEILPQEAGPGEVILSKRHELGLLSNMAGEHYRLIVAATWEKVRQNPAVKKVLLATGDLILKPDHHQEPNAPAAWRYYEILSRIRADLQKQMPASRI